jgi:hypothetical protein
MTNILKKKYALCFWGQLRAIDVIIDNLKNFLINPLNADVYVYAQYSNSSTDDNINLFDTDNKELYYSSDITKTFINYKELENKNNHFNYLSNTHLKVYENFYKIYQKYGDIFEQNYDYIILSRTDYYHMIPFPDIIKLYEKNDLIWSFEGHEYGGINGTLLCVPSKYIKDCLCCTYNILQDTNNITFLNNQNLNVETYFKIAFEKYNFNFGTIQPSAFITASGFNELSTWGNIQYHEPYNIFYKYEYQFNDACNTRIQYDTNEYKWSYIYIDGKINKIILHKNIIFTYY